MQTVRGNCPHLSISSRNIGLVNFMGTLTLLYWAFKNRFITKRVSFEVKYQNGYSLMDSSNQHFNNFELNLTSNSSCQRAGRCSLLGGSWYSVHVLHLYHYVLICFKICGGLRRFPPQGIQRTTLWLREICYACCKFL